MAEENVVWGWRCGSSGRGAQAQSPNFKPQYQQKKSKIRKHGMGWRQAQVAEHEISDLIQSTSKQNKTKQNKKTQKNPHKKTQTKLYELKQNEFKTWYMYTMENISHKKNKILSFAAA
jgi:hypothetical protein